MQNAEFILFLALDGLFRLYTAAIFESQKSIQQWFLVELDTLVAYFFPEMPGWDDDLFFACYFGWTSVRKVTARSPAVARVRPTVMVVTDLKGYPRSMIFM